MCRRHAGVPQRTSSAPGREHGVPRSPGVRNRRKNGAGGGSRTLTSRQAQRIFIPSTAFAARTQRFEAHASGLRSRNRIWRAMISVR